MSDPQTLRSRGLLSRGAQRAHLFSLGQVDDANCLLVVLIVNAPGSCVSQLGEGAHGGAVWDWARARLKGSYVCGVCDKKLAWAARRPALLQPSAC